MDDTDRANVHICKLFKAGDHTGSVYVYMNSANHGSNAGWGNIANNNNKMTDTEDIGDGDTVRANTPDTDNEGALPHRATQMGHLYEMEARRTPPPYLFAAAVLSKHLC